MSKTLALSVVVGATIGQSYFRALESAQQRSERLGKTWTSTNAKLGATRNVLKYQTLLGQLREKQAALGRSSTRLDRGIAEVERRYREARRAARGYGIELGDVAREHDRLGRALARTESQQRALEGKQGAGARFGALRTRLLGLAGAAYGAGRMVGAAMDRAEQGRYLGTVINPADGDRDAGVARARTHARAFARDSLATEQEVLEIEYALSSAGLGETVARAGTELVHKLAKVTRGAPEQVGEIVGVTFNTMAGGLEGTAEEKMQRIGDVLAKTQFKFQIRDFGQLGESLKYASAHAVSAKVSLEQTAATIGVLNTAGLQGSMAGTAFGAVLRNLTKASDELGFEVVRDDAGALDLIATVEGLKTALEDDDTDARNDLLQELFGDEGKRGAVPLLDMLDQLKAGVAEVSAAAGSGLVDAEYLRFLDSASGQWTMLKQNVAQVGAVFGGVLLPAVNAVVAPMARVAGWVASGIERYPVLGQALGAVAAGVALAGAALAVTTGVMWLKHASVGALTPALGGLADGVRWATARLRAFNAAALVTGARARALAVGGAIRGFGAALMGLATRAIPVAIGRLRTFNAVALVTGARARALAVGGAMRGFGAALMGLATRAIPVAIGALKGLTAVLIANPIGLAIAAVVAVVVGAAWLIRKYWAPIRAWWGGLWQGIGATVGQAAATLGDALGSFSPLDAIRSAWRAVTDWLTTFSLAEAAGKVVATLGDALGSFSPLDAIRSAWRAVTDWLTTFSLAETVGKVAATLGDALGGFSPLDAIRSAWRAVTDWLTTFSLAEAAGKVVATLGDALGSFSPLDAIRSAWRAVTDWLTTFSLAEAAGKVVATLGDALGSFSPLDAIRSAWRAAADWLTTFSLAESAGKVVATLGDALGGFSPLDAIRSAWRAVTDWLATFSLAESAGKVVATLGDALGSFSPLDAIRSAWRAVTDWLTTFSLAESAGKVVATLGDALGSFSPLDAIRSAWRAAADWLTTFSLAESAGKVVATLGDALGSFSPLDAIKTAWKEVTDWLDKLSLAETAGKAIDTLGTAANTAWQGVTHLFGGDDDTEPAPVVTAIHTAQQAIVGRLGAVVRSVDALGAAPRPVLAGALAGAAIGAAAAAPVAPAQPLPLPVASAPAPQARAAPRTITVNIQPGAVAITLAAAPDTDLDTLAEALQHRMADLLRQATTEAMDAEADEVA